jgi:hypothetical protein
MRPREAGTERIFHRRQLQFGEKRGSSVGPTKRGKGSKIMAIADRHCLPVAVHVVSASPNESTLVESTLQRRFFRQTPKRLIGDKAYDSDPLDQRVWTYRYEGAMLRYLQSWIDELRWQRLASFQKLVQMLLDHLDGILNYCRSKVRFGVVEAINSNIKTLLRRGRDYKNLAYLLLKAQRMNKRLCTRIRRNPHSSGLSQ